MQLRHATPEDIPALCLLEKECFSEPWSERSFADFFRNECSRCFAAWEKNRLCGYIGLYLVCGEAEITNLAVSGDARRQGIGGALLEAAMAVEGAERILLEVRSSNLAARRLYEKYGFTVDGIRRSFYAKPREDAVLMSRSLTKETEYADTCF